MFATIRSSDFLALQVCKLTIVGRMPSERSRERLQPASSSRRSWEVQAPERMRAKMSMKSLSACIAPLPCQRVTPKNSVAASQPHEQDDCDKM